MDLDVVIEQKRMMDLQDANDRIALLENHIDTLEARLSLPTSKDLDFKINELNTQISNLKAQLGKLGAHADELEKELRETLKEKNKINRERQRLVQENSQLRREMNNVIVSVPPSEQEKVIMQMAEFSAEQIELAKQQTAQNIVDDLKNQILSNMEIMPENKRYEYFETCCSIFGNVVVINKIIPELKSYIRNSIKKDSKTNLQINIDNSQTSQTFDVKGEKPQVYPNATKINYYN